MTLDPAFLPDESILAIAGNLTRVSGFMGVKQKPYSLILTNQRLIFAEVSKEKSSALLTEAREEAKAGGKGFLGQAGAQRKALSGYHERYWQIRHPESQIQDWERRRTRSRLRSSCQLSRKLSARPASAELPKRLCPGASAYTRGPRAEESNRL